jgi:hypothetical protein
MIEVDRARDDLNRKRQSRPLPGDVHEPVGDGQLSDAKSPTKHWEVAFRPAAGAIEHAIFTVVTPCAQSRQ